MDWLKNLSDQVYQFFVQLDASSPSGWFEGFGTAVFVAVLTLTAWLLRKPAVAGLKWVFAVFRRHQTLPGSTVTAEHAQGQRDNLIAVVRSQWINGYLEHSLYRRILLRLGLKEQPDAVVLPWALEVQRPASAPKPTDTGEMMQIFDGFAGSMLILGEPGSGKTITMLELARQLLDRAEDDQNEPVPVVFNLSSWAVEKKPLHEWLVLELDRLYNVPPALGRYWVNNRQLLALLDGLDEVDEDVRNECLQAIENYHTIGSKWVVCSRLAEYDALSTRLHCGGAVCTQALSNGAVAGYLGKLRMKDLKTLIATDSDLQELARSPLVLNVMVVASEMMAPLGSTLTQEQKRSRIFDAYLRRVLLEHRDARHQWSPAKVLVWLRWLAKQLNDRDLATFRLEDVQRDWLHSETRSRMYYCAQSWGFAGLFGLAFGLIVAMAFGLEMMLAGGPADLILGMISGLIIATTSRGAPIVPVTHLRWNWRKGGIGLVVGLVVGLVFTLSAGILYQLLVGMLFCLSGGLLAGLKGHAVIVPASTPNRPIWRSAANWLVTGITAGLVGGLLVVLGLELESEMIRYGVSFLRNMLGSWILGWLLIGLFVGLSIGGAAFLRHWHLRFLLWRYDSTPLPWQVVSWLDECCSRIILYRTGGSYLFIHRMLREHIANLDDDFLNDLDQEYRRRAKLTAA